MHFFPILARLAQGGLGRLGPGSNEGLVWAQMTDKDCRSGRTAARCFDDFGGFSLAIATMMWMIDDDDEEEDEPR